MTLSRRALLGALGTLPLARLAQGEPAQRLTIIHMNDFHSRHEPVDARAMSCVADGSAAPGCFGGSARLASAIRAQRQAAEGDGRIVVLLDGGDQFQGSLFFTRYQGQAELAVQHAVGTDAMAVGNHEFDKGPAVLGAYAEAARFPLVSSNLDVSAEPALRARIRPWAMLERGGMRLGLVGLTTLETQTGSSPGANVRFLAPDPALAAAVRDIRAQGVQLVILLSHMGVGFDCALADAGPSVIIGGHSHTLLSNSEPGAFSRHPTPDGVGGLVVQAAAYGRYLGRLDLDLAADGTVLAYGGDCVHVGLDVPE
ncbi:MAG: metallophosphoesterase, partial [Acetobacteraceae bacterium]|nr:metallophosphoesterase [Acetobacteraceae bacterium]